jgi:hypothetical protein
VNGFLGFKITSSGYQYIMYAVIVAFVFIGLAAALFWIKVIQKKEYKKVSDRKTLDAGFEAFRHRGVDEEDVNERRGVHQRTLSTEEGHDHQTGVFLHQMPPETPPPFDTSHPGRGAGEV